MIWGAYQRYHGKPDGDAVLVQAPTLDLNPTFDRRAVEKAYEEDPASAAAEYGAQFRSDVESFVSRETIDDCVIPGVREVPPVVGVFYEAFVDPSGGSADGFTLAIGHRKKGGDPPVAIVDCMRERRPPFSPEAVVQEFAELLKTYGVSSVTGDRYAGEWPREAFRRHGITYNLAEKPKSGLYGDALALLNSGRIELVDHPRMIAQLAGLERRASHGGRASIDHGPGGHDDQS